MKALNTSFKIYLLGFLFFEILCLWYASNFSRFDQMRWINVHHSIPLDYLFQGFTFLAEIYLSLFMLAYFFRTRKDFVKPFILSYILATIIIQVLKHGVFPDELRPFAYFKGVEYGWHFVAGVFMNEFNSFPSGHTSVAWFLFFWITMMNQSKLWAFFCALFAMGVAYSRVYLFQHFPIDTALGAFIGFSSSSLFYYVFILSKKSA